MTTWVKKFKILVSAFTVLTIIYLLFPNKGGSVFWAIYAFGLKDAFIISLCLIFFFANKYKDRLADYLAIGVSCYLVVPTIIRVCCAIDSEMNYKAYRIAINNSEYSYFLLLVLVFISVLIYHGCKNERKI